MPQVFTFKIDDEDVFQCELHHQRCEANNKNGTQCKRECCIPYIVCAQHLTKLYHLKKKKSNIMNAGLGLFAWDDTKGENEVIFPANTKIARYLGEVLTAEEIRERYGDKNAPYGMLISQRADMYMDSACKRCVSSLANTFGSKLHQNAKFSVNNKHECFLVSTKPIKNHQEILADYSDSYNLHEPGVSHSTKYVRPKK